ncbi:MAG: alpha/beta hydrolase-fold protein [Bacteroidales bacterium]|jgi:enterochelin esterase family protein
MKKITVLFILLTALVTTASAQELRNFSFGREPIVSPEITGSEVTFRLLAPRAYEVRLFGSWNADYRSTLAMSRDTSGIWSATIPLPDPEIYTYSFIVDGVSMNDPSNVLMQRDGTRYLSMLLVEGGISEYYKEATQRGNLKSVWYDSPTIGFQRRMTVYTPYGYETNPRKKYPVLYLLHGAGGDEEAWSSMGRARQILDNMIEKGEAEPMIVVMPNGNPWQQAAKTLMLPEKEFQWGDPSTANLYVNSLVKDIIPYVEKHFRTINKPESRAVAGLSMGGGHTMSVSNLYPGMFGYICPLSMGIRDGQEIDAELQAIKKAGYKLYWVGCGDQDFLFESANALHQALERNGLEHTYHVSGGGHTWPNWRTYLTIFGKLLFK